MSEFRCKNQGINYQETKKYFLKIGSRALNRAVNLTLSKKQSIILLDRVGHIEHVSKLYSFI